MKPLHVVAAVIRDSTGRVLLAQRPQGRAEAGLWEFPGGKVEAGEDPPRALARELAEELGIGARIGRPLIRVPAAEGRLLLDAWQVARIEGTPRGREGQRLAWVESERLGDYPMPAPDLPVATAVRLPPCYLVTPEPQGDPEHFLATLERALEAGMKLVQLRARTLDEAALCALARRATALCHRFGARLLLNGDPELALRAGADGVHLNGRWLARLRARPLPPGMWVAASCHDRAQLDRARALGADFAVLGPVAPTASHPGAEPMGWCRFEALVAQAALPVYALGGVGPDDLSTAWRHGAQGIAAIRALWPAAS